MNENPSQTEIDLAVERMLTKPGPDYRREISKGVQPMCGRESCNQCDDLANELWKADEALEKALAARDYYKRWVQGITATFVAAVIGRASTARSRRTSRSTGKRSCLRFVGITSTCVRSLRGSVLLIGRIQRSWR